MVVKNMRDGATITLTKEKQDRDNCFRYGPYMMYRSGKGLTVENLMSIGDQAKLDEQNEVLLIPANNKLTLIDLDESDEATFSVDQEDFEFIESIVKMREGGF